MTLIELSEKVGLKESTLKIQFNREAEKLAREGIIIKKIGRGKTADYTLEYDNSYNDQRAVTIFEEEKTDIYLADDMLKMMDWNLLVFIGICLTPLLTFRGSYADFLRYAGLIPSDSNIKELKQVLIEMDADYIGYYPDKTDENYFTASIYRKVEKELRLPIERLRECRKIQIDNNSRSFIPILKVWMATEKAIEHQPYTIADLSNMTGLAPSTIKRVGKQLRNDNVYISKKDFDPETMTSKGVNSEMNGFFE